MIIRIHDKFYSEPEIRALVKELEAVNVSLRARVSALERERQIGHYSDELR